MSRRQEAMAWEVDPVKRQLDAELRPDGYNAGFNVGEAAGQTVFHLHVHVIPGKGNYLVTPAKPLATGGSTRQEHSSISTGSVAASWAGLREAACESMEAQEASGSGP